MSSGSVSPNSEGSQFMNILRSFQRASDRRLAQLILLAGVQVSAFAGAAYVQHNLVSDIPGLADQTDPNLVNPWGLASSSTSPLWVSNNHSGTSTVYTGSGQPFPAGN